MMHFVQLAWPASTRDLHPPTVNYLKRDLETDQARMSRAVDYYADMGRPYQLMMFPEGTDKTPFTTARSDQFARTGKGCPA